MLRPLSDCIGTSSWATVLDRGEARDRMDWGAHADPTATIDSRRTAAKEAKPAAIVTECDVADGIPAIPAPGAEARMLVLVRMFSEPLGIMEAVLPGDGFCPNDLACAIVNEFGPQLRERFAECGLAWNGDLPVSRLNPPLAPRFIASRERVMGEGPPITVAVCTRNRPEGLAVTLDTLSAQEYQKLRVLVVDNAPSDDRVRQVTLAAARKHDLAIKYVTEPRPGLSWARNCAIEASDTEVIAFIDDDERCDRWWAAELARGFVEVPEAGAVTGVIVPGELATESEALFEKFLGIRTGRGFARAVFSPATARQQSPLFPRPPFGAGGNMAFRRDALDRIGRFDCALGAGTLTQGCEDTAAFSALLLEGGTIVYQPTAIVRHYYRRDYAALRRQLQGYGRGLTSFYISMLVRRPSCVTEMLRLSRQVARDRFFHQGQRFSGLGEDFPRDLLWANLIGRLQGPFTYAAARVHAQRLRRMVPER
jgi:glycosyltransferase involved in cell wall biosynthesis